VFTGGIGEHSAAVRGGVLDGLGWLGFAPDATANAGDGPLLTLPASARPAYAIATDEEAVIACHTFALR
jgi:acetate kinase